MKKFCLTLLLFAATFSSAIFISCDSSDETVIDVSAKITETACEHSYGDWTVLEEATCCESGIKQRTCTLCGYTDEEYIEELPHSYEEETISPTCTDKGYTKYTCSVCGESYNDDYVDATGHDYAEINRTSGSCTEYICVEYECTVCGDTYEEETDELGHNYGDWVTYKDATCSSEGIEARECSECGANDTRDIDKTEHNIVTEVIPPTCTEQGYTLHSCADCDYNTTDDYTEATGHTYIQTIVPSTCTEEGHILYTCENCGDSYRENITELSEHDYGEWTVVKEATCTDKGIEIRTCSVCQHPETRNTDALGHNYTDTVISPTCTEDGYTEHTCTRCGNNYTDNSTEATGHSYTAQVIAPTCTEQGYTIYVCHCGDNYIDTDNYTAATGHSYDTGTYFPSASVDESGYTEYVCSICGYSYKEDDGVYLYTKELDYSKPDGEDYYIVKGFSSEYDISQITTIYIPSYYIGLPVTEIASSAFAGNTKIQYVYIGLTVTTIGASAFSSCTALKYVKMPSSLTTIGDTAFHSCSALDSITIPSAVKSIGEKAFYNCTALQEIYYNAENANDLGSTDTFAKAGTNADGLIVYISAGVQTIPQNLFYYRTGNIPYITAIIFEENSKCTEIGANAFSKLSYLQYIVLPDAELGSSALGKIAAKIYYMGTTTDWNSNSSLTSYYDTLINNGCIIYYYSAETPDFTDANIYWHYVDGAATVWTDN